MPLAQHDVLVKEDSLVFNGADYIELYVGNAQQASYFYRAAMGFRLVAYAGPETGQHDRKSYVLQQGAIRFVLTTPLRPDNEIADHIHRHGDGVRDVALAVDDARDAWRETVRRGARSVQSPFELRDGHGIVRMASIAAYGDTIHTFVERIAYHGAFLPGYREVTRDALARPTGLFAIDHISGNVGWNEMQRWAGFYAEVMEFSLSPGFGRNDFSSGSSMVMAKDVNKSEGRLKFLIGEVADGYEQPEMEQYLEFYHGPGVQHIALATGDMLHTVATMQERGVEFLGSADLYSDPQRLLAFAGPGTELAKFGVQAARDDEGDMLRIFTRPMEDRPTLLFEIVQRVGSQGPGGNN